MKTPKDVVVDPFGRVKTVNSVEEQATLNRLRSQGEVIAVILRYGNQVSVEVKGPPDLALAELLEQAVEGYKKACFEVLQQDGKEPN